MKAKCAKCKKQLDSSKGDIITIMPVFFNDEFLEFYLCRPHALAADKMNGEQFRKWIHKREK